MKGNVMKKIVLYLVLVALIALALLMIFQKNPIKIGCAVSLSGKNAPLGIAVKDGVSLAVEEINASGGINGRELELLIKDDENDPKTARKVDAELIKEGVCVIIGHVTSAMSQAVLSLMDEKQMLLLSPITGSLKVLEGDDNLISIHPPNTYEQEALAHYAITRINRISIIYDEDNGAFSEPWVNVFSDHFKNYDGTIDGVYGFSSKDNDWNQATDQLLTDPPQGVLIIASAIDTARICQQIEKRYPQQIVKFSSGWGLDNALIQQGGKNVDGLIIMNSWDNDSNRPEYLAFKEAFMQRYKREPQFAETFGYETFMILAHVLKTDIKKKPMLIKDKMLSIGEFQGLQGSLYIDQMGKTNRELFLFIVEDNAFKRITP